MNEKEVKTRKKLAVLWEECRKSCLCACDSAVSVANKTQRHALMFMPLTWWYVHGFLWGKRLSVQNISRYHRGEFHPNRYRFVPWNLRWKACGQNDRISVSGHNSFSRSSSVNWILSSLNLFLLLWTLCSFDFSSFCRFQFSFSLPRGRARIAESLVRSRDYYLGLKCGPGEMKLHKEIKWRQISISFYFGRFFITFNVYYWMYEWENAHLKREYLELICEKFPFRDQRGFDTLLVFLFYQKFYEFICKFTSILHVSKDTFRSFLLCSHLVIFTFVFFHISFPKWLPLFTTFKTFLLRTSRKFLSVTFSLLWIT